jgi:hypothetical protein
MLKYGFPLKLISPTTSPEIIRQLIGNKIPDEKSSKYGGK